MYECTHVISYLMQGYQCSEHNAGLATLTINAKSAGLNNPYLLYQSVQSHTTSKATTTLGSHIDSAFESSYTSSLSPRIILLVVHAVQPGHPANKVK